MVERDKEEREGGEETGRECNGGAQEGLEGRDGVSAEIATNLS